MKRSEYIFNIFVCTLLVPPMAIGITRNHSVDITLWAALILILIFSGIYTILCFLEKVLKNQKEIKDDIKKLLEKEE